MKKIKFILTSFVLVSFISCTLDNENPNRIHQEDIRPDQILPGAMVSTYAVQAVTMNVLGNRMMQNWYGNINDVTGLDSSPEFTLNIDNSFYTGIWDGTYRGVNNFHQILNYDSEDFDNHKAIAYIMEAYYMQYIVDLYGNAPYSDAFKGSDQIAPAYDDDAVIYLNLIENINKAFDLIDNADSNDKAVASEDVMYAGDMAAWKNFGNLLKIRLLLRQSNLTGTNPNGDSYATYIQNEFNAIAAMGIPTATAATINPGYNTSNASQQNPNYNIFYGTTGNATQYYNQTTASGYIADFLNGNVNGVVDPRRAQLYVLQGGQVVAAYQGENTGYDSVTLSKIKALFPTAASDGLVMSSAEAWFLLAEAYDKNYLTGDAEAAFTAGITASFTFLGSSNVTTYLSNIDAVPGLGWNGGNHLEAIMTQKWLAVNGVNPIESFIDYTRTGYPDIPLATTALYPNRPYRLSYPLSEFVANSANVPSLSQAQLFVEGPFWKN
jgi:hypothetical protein